MRPSLGPGVLTHGGSPHGCAPLPGEGSDVRLQRRLCSCGCGLRLGPSTCRPACRPAAPRPAQIAQEHAGPAVQPGRARGLEEMLRHCQPSARTVLPLDALRGPQVRRPQCPPCRTLPLAVPD